MPLYEYHCDVCQTDFETLVRSSSEVPVCPSCGDHASLTRQFSVPAAAQVHGGKSSAPLPAMCGPSGGCGPMGCGGGMCGIG